MPDLSQPPPPGWRLRLAHGVYQVALHLALPLILGLAFWRSRREPLYRAHLSHRFGFGPVAPAGAVWVFAASLGETRAVSPLVTALLQAGHGICLTHSSPAGLSEGRRLFTDPRVTHRYAPFDWAGALALFLRRQRPRLGLIVESEVWAGQLLVARRFGLPMVQVNGNLLDRTIDREKRRFGGLRLELFQQFTAILTKTPTYRARYRRAGVRAERIALPGELKFDQAVPAEQIDRGSAQRALWANGLPVVLIASSVTGEEAELADLVARLSGSARIVWAPRSPQRFDAVAQRLNAAGHRIARRSTALGPDLTGDIDAPILLGDSLGEMAYYYALADVVFVGASLVPHGGHNIVEPLSQGKPVVMGPSIFGITFPAIEAEAAGALRLAPDAKTLGDMLAGLLDDPGELQRFTEAARGFAAHHVGAAQRAMAILAPLLKR